MVINDIEVNAGQVNVEGDTEKDLTMTQEAAATKKFSVEPGDVAMEIPVTDERVPVTNNCTVHGDLEVQSGADKNVENEIE